MSREIEIRSRHDGAGARGALRAIPDRAEYLAFRLADEKYAVPVRLVREIVKPPPITEVPRGPEDLLGIIAVRGQVVPARDLRRKLRLLCRPLTRRARVLVVEREGESVGFMVDEVYGVVRLLPEEIEEAPAVSGGSAVEAVVGVARPKGEMLILLGLDDLLGEGEGEDA